MSNPAFHPYGAQEILSIQPSVFALLRTSLDGNIRTLCLNNVSRQNLEIVVDLKPLSLADATSLTDILSQEKFSATDHQLKIKFAPYEIIWLSR